MAKNKKKAATPSAPQAAAHASTPGALRRELADVEHALAYGPCGFGWQHTSKPEKRAELETRRAELLAALSPNH